MARLGLVAGHRLISFVVPAEAGAATNYTSHQPLTAPPPPGATSKDQG